MYMRYVANAFSLQMLPVESLFGVISYDYITEGEFRRFAKDAKSIVGHPDTARVLGVECNRESVVLTEDDILVVAQLIGGRLPEGATTLPEGARFKYLAISFTDNTMARK